MQILQLGTINPQWATAKYMEAHEINDWQQGVMQPQPKPDPKMEELKLKAQIEQQKADRGIQMDAAKIQMEGAAAEQKMALERRAAEQEQN